MLVAQLICKKFIWTKCFMFHSLNWCHLTRHRSGAEIIAKERRVECNVVRVFHAIPGIHDVAHSIEHCGVAPNLPNDLNQNFPIFAMANFPSSFLWFRTKRNNEHIKCNWYNGFNVLPTWLMDFWNIIVSFSVCWRVKSRSKMSCSTWFCFSRKRSYKPNGAKQF